MFANDTEAKTPFSSQVTLHLKYISLWSLLHCINFKRHISATSRPWRIWTQRCWPHTSPWMTTSSCIPLRWIRSPLALTLCQPWAPCSSPYPPLLLQPLPPAAQWCRSCHLGPLHPCTCCRRSAMPQSHPSAALGMFLLLGPPPHRAAISSTTGASLTAMTSCCQSQSDQFFSRGIR